MSVAPLYYPVLYEPRERFFGRSDVLFDHVPLQPRDLQASLDAGHGGTRQAQESCALPGVIHRQGLLDIPADVGRRVLKLRSHPAIEVQRLASREAPDVHLKLIGQLADSQALGGT